MAFPYKQPEFYHDVILAALFNPKNFSWNLMLLLVNFSPFRILKEPQIYS